MFSTCLCKLSCICIDQSILSISKFKTVAYLRMVPLQANARNDILSIRMGLWHLCICHFSSYNQLLSIHSNNLKLCHTLELLIYEQVHKVTFFQWRWFSDICPIVIFQITFNFQIFSYGYKEIMIQTWLCK